MGQARAERRGLQDRAVRGQWRSWVNETSGPEATKALRNSQEPWEGHWIDYRARDKSSELLLFQSPSTAGAEPHVGFSQHPKWDVSSFAVITQSYLLYVCLPTRRSVGQSGGVCLSACCILVPLSSGHIKIFAEWINWFLTRIGGGFGKEEKILKWGDFIFFISPPWTGNRAKMIVENSRCPNLPE